MSDPDDPLWRDVLVAIDVGTSGARAAAFDLAGVRRLETRRNYRTAAPLPGFAEQDALAWRSAAVTCLATLVKRLGPRRRVHAIGLTGQCPSVVVLDERDRPIAPAMIYRDNRATTEAAALRERFGERWIHERTGHRPAAFHIAPKLIWLQAHDPESWNAASLVLQPRDDIGLALTGEVATDGSHAAATLLFDLRRRRWDPELLDAASMRAELLPPILPSTTVLGRLRPRVAERVGLPATTPVVLGGADSQACALGAGVVAAGPVSEMAGSSTCLNSVVDEPLAVLDVTHYPHVVGDDFTTETGLNTTGAALTWFVDLAYGRRRGRAADRVFEQLDAEAAAVPPGSDGVLALAALADGERTDPDLRAAFTGLSLRHDRAVLARALLEGVAFAIRAQLELLVAGETVPSELRVSGGDARIGTWNRIKADVTGLPVSTIVGDAAVTGVAMLAGLGAGVYAGVEDAIARCVAPSAPIEPDTAVRGRYDERYGAYRELVEAAVVRASAT